ncbi:MAG: hypothetical protein J6S54_06755 [Lentisphaeria bacterium]|nr:hypothetical protein [Lentisphaeria bacterium]
MTLKFDWNDHESAVMKELIRLTPSLNDGHCIETRLMFDLLFLLRKLRKGNERCFQLWKHFRSLPFLPGFLGNSSTLHWEGYFNHWWITAFAQGATEVLAGADPLEKKNFHNYDAVYDFFFSDSAERSIAVRIPRLPERLKEKNLLAAIAAKDVAKIIVLYDLELEQGEKLRNIFNILLNRKAYSILMTLQQMYGGLEQIDRSCLMAHFLNDSSDPGKKAFDGYMIGAGFTFDREMWNRLCVNIPLSSHIQKAFSMGVPLEWPLLENNAFSVSVGRCFSFILEFDLLWGPWGRAAAKHKRIFDWQIERLQKFFSVGREIFLMTEKNEA